MIWKIELRIVLDLWEFGEVKVDERLLIHKS